MLLIYLIRQPFARGWTDAFMREGVLIQTAKPIGRSAAARAIERNFERRGRLSVAWSTLEKLFD